MEKWKPILREVAVTTRAVIDCDKCGATDIKEPRCLAIDLDHFTDAAGSSDTHQEVFDLCPRCVYTFANVALRRMSVEDRLEFMKAVTKERYDAYMRDVRNVKS